MIIPSTSEKNLRALLKKLQDCSFDTLELTKASSGKWTIVPRNPDTGLPRSFATTAFTTKEFMIAIGFALEVFQSISDKARQDGYDSAVEDTKAPDRV